MTTPDIALAELDTLYSEGPIYHASTEQHGYGYTNEELNYTSAEEPPEVEIKDKAMISSDEAETPKPPSPTMIPIIDKPDPIDDKKIRNSANEENAWGEGCCPVCFRRVKPGKDSITLAQEVWHRKCFKCSFCKLKLRHHGFCFDGMQISCPDCS